LEELMLIRATVALLLTLAAHGAVRSQRDVATPALTTVINEALRDQDWQVRHAAVSLVDAFGTGEDVAALRHVLVDERAEVSRAAWRAYLAWNPEEVGGAIRRVSMGETWEDVYLLTRLLRSMVKPDHVDDLNVALGRAKSPHARYALLLLLTAAGATAADAAEAYAKQCVTTVQILNASALLPLTPDTPAQRERVMQWLSEEHAVVRHRCAVWMRAHGTTGPWVDQYWIPDYVEPDMYEAESHRAARAFGTAWRPTTRSAVLDVVRNGRVVLVGDSHGSKCIAELTLDCCAASVGGGERGKVAFGYEPPMEMFFALVKPRAEALGLVPVPLEPVENAPPLSLRARDAEIGAAIRAWLDQSASHKLVALYGWNHILGAGHVEIPGAVRILTCPPAGGLLAHLRCESLERGVLAADEHRWFVHPEYSDTFFVICDDRTWCPDTRPSFTAWLARKRNR
jgi:hypothetical protein